MAGELQDGSEVVDFQEDCLTEDELVNKRNTKVHANIKHKKQYCVAHNHTRFFFLPPQRIQGIVVYSHKTNIVRACMHVCVHVCVDVYVYVVILA